MGGSGMAQATRLRDSAPDGEMGLLGRDYPVKEGEDRIPQFTVMMLSYYVCHYKKPTRNSQPISIRRSLHRSPSDSIRSPSTFITPLSTSFPPFCLDNFLMNSVLLKFFAYYNLKKMDQGSAGCALREHMRILLFSGLVLSETQVLVNLKTYAPSYFFPYTTLAYFVLATAHLGYVFARYALGGGRQKGAVLEWYEQIVLPLSVLILSLLGRGSGMVQFKSSCAVMLVLQSLLIIGKVIYFNSVTPELAQISTISKLVRVVKLNVVGLLPLVVGGQLVVVVVVALCQAISLSAFFLKFTYQKCLYEYVLLVCVFCGFVSAVENVFQTILSLNYVFIGQLGALFFYLHDNNYLKSVLELKYSSSLANHSETKQDDEVLAGLLFMQECLFENKRTLMLSQSAQNQGALHASAIMQRVPGGVGSQRGLDPLEVSSCELVFRIQSGLERRQVTSALFQAYCQRFHQTDSFSCFQFTIGAALQLGGSFTNKALVLYYSFIQRKRAKASIFQNCKFHYTYQRILKQVEARESDKEDINFIEFSDNLRMLGGEIEECLGNELKLVEQLADRSRKVEMMTDARIFARNQHKARIRTRVEKCIDQRIYFCSNQFKFLFLLYHITIQKRYLNLRQQLKHYFLASQVQQLRYADSENSLIVLSGFNHGEIINSNQVFKNHFGLALSSFARSNISQFIPTEKQRAKHAALMAQAVESRKHRQKQPHSSYQCLLAIEREMGSVKLKVVQSFSISIRIHYENSGTFNYICSLAPLQQQQGGREKDTLTLLRRDCQNFTNKGIQLTVVQNRTADQLDERLELTEIDFSYDSQGIRNSNKLLQRTIGKERGVKTQRYLQEKTLRIEKKMIDEGIEEYRCGWSNIFQMTAIIILAIFILIALGLMGGKLDNLKKSISQLVMPVAQAQLVHSKILLEQEILSLQAQTPYFPDDLCFKAQLPSISDYVTNILYADLEENTDKFIRAISLPHSFGPLGENLYVRKFSSMPYLMNPVATTISYQKQIQLMKSQSFSWLSTLRNTSLNYYFYSQIFPSILYNSTIDGPQTLTSLLQHSQDAYINELSASLSELRVISLVLIGVLGALAVGLRLRDNRALMNFLGIVQCIPADHLGQRIRELKSAIGQLHQLRANRIEAIEFDHTFTVQIKKDKLDPQTLSVDEFAQWHMREKADYELEDSEGSCGQLDREFQHHKTQESSLGQGEFFRLLKYNKLYLTVSISLLVCIMALSDGALGKQRTRLDTLVLCSAASLQLSTIQQKFINLAAYNWLKVLSLQKTDFNMTQARLMFNEATNSLMQSTYLTKIPAAYSKDFSDQVLYGDVCSFFKSRQACLFYRNNIFSSGLSMVIPFVVKEMVQIDQLSSNYSYYLLNMCDKTWLLFEGIVPMTNNISAHGFKAMTARSEKGFEMRFVEIAFTTLLLLIATILFQYRRYRRERLIRQEVFSLDTVQNLYAVAEFKPYFNNIYYS